MNYELLKLSKILPTIKGKKIVDIYEESLEKARQAYYDQQDDQMPSARGPERKAGFNSNLRGAVSNKNIRSHEASIDRLQKIEGLMSGYNNLRILMTGAEPLEKVAHLIEDGNQGRRKKRESEEASKVQSATPTSAHGNFVFRKKKLHLKNTTDGNNVTRFAFGKGFSFVAEDSPALNGTKAVVNNQNQDVVVRHKRKYLKDLKQDARRTFHNPRDKYDSRGMHQYSSSPVSEIQYKSTSNKMGTVVLDGTNLQNLEPGRSSSTKLTPSNS